MKTDKSLRAVGMAVFGLAVWDSRALLSAWLHSPLDRLGWLALFLWVSPVVWLSWNQRNLGVGRLWYICGSLAALAFGAISSMNSFGYLALAAIISAVPGFSIYSVLWFLTAASWMPAFSWAANTVPLPVLIVGRVLMAGTGAFLLALPALRAGERSFPSKQTASATA